MKAKTWLLVGIVALGAVLCLAGCAPEPTRSRYVPLVAAPTSVPPPATALPPATPPDCADWAAGREYIGQAQCICGPVASTRHASSTNGQPTFINIGAPYPSPERFQVVIWGRDRGNFPGAPESLYAWKTICVTGLVELYADVMQIQAGSPTQFQTP